MALLKEDGSLDIERINKLPIREYIEELESLTQEQYEEYCSKLPANDTYEPVRPVMVDSIEDELRRGCVLADEYIRALKEKLEKDD